MSNNKHTNNDKASNAITLDAQAVILFNTEEGTVTVVSDVTVCCANINPVIYLG